MITLASIFLAAASHGSVPETSEVREVRIIGPAGVLAGTLLLPHCERLGRSMAVVFVTGSGLQDRDETIFGHKPFREIAEALAEAGIASLRCDDRGFGMSTGNPSTATTLDFAEDAKAQVAYLIDEVGFDAARVGLVGHSEGGLIGALMAAGPSPSTAFAVLMAPPGIPGLEVLAGQTEDLYRITRRDPMLAGIAVERHREVMEATEAGTDAAALFPMVRELVRAQLECNSGTPPADATVDSVMPGAMAQLTSPWMKTFLSLDPATAFAACAVPTLALFGGKDSQVPPSRNVAPIEDAARAAPVTPEIVVFEGLNHLFQRARTGSITEYAAIKSGVDPEVLDRVTEWVGSVAIRFPNIPRRLPLPRNCALIAAPPNQKEFTRCRSESRVVEMKQPSRCCAASRSCASVRGSPRTSRSGSTTRSPPRSSVEPRSGDRFARSRCVTRVPASVADSVDPALAALHGTADRVDQSEAGGQQVDARVLVGLAALPVAAAQALRVDRPAVRRAVEPTIGRDAANEAQH